MARLFPGALVRLCPQSHLEGGPGGGVAAWKVCGSRDVVGGSLLLSPEGQASGGGHLGTSTLRREPKEVPPELEWDVEGGRGRKGQVVCTGLSVAVTHKAIAGWGLDFPRSSQGRSCKVHSAA